MNDFSLKDLILGQEVEFKELITQDVVQKFIEITGDINPLHCDEDYARKRGYSCIVVHGLLTSSFFSKLAGVYLPGIRSLILETNFQFIKPVFPNDKILFQGKVKEIFENFDCFDLKITATNQHCIKVIRGHMKIGVYREQE
jgi:3-hydroxybutyryl-CoA dehydratase